MAAGMRFREASRLAIGGDRLAAIYLAGYAAEMLLKAAYFRLVGWDPTDSIDLADMQNARKYATTTLGSVWPGNLHDLTGWAALLVTERRKRRVEYLMPFARSLNARVKRVYLNWREVLRYHSNRPYEGEVTVVLQAVHWLLAHYRFL